VHLGFCLVTRADPEKQAPKFMVTFAAPC